MDLPRYPRSSVIYDSTLDKGQSKVGHGIYIEKTDAGEVSDPGRSAIQRSFAVEAL